MLERFLLDYWPHLAFILSIILGGAAAIHAAMTKDDVRAAIGWAGICLASPLIGPVAYLIAGINRIRRETLSEQHSLLRQAYTANPSAYSDDVGALIGPQFASLKTLGDRVTQFPLLAGNRISLLRSGDEAYPAMIAAIDQARRSVALQSYIFDNDRAGRAIADALVRAHRRGVEVRVLIDSIGAKYSRPPIAGLLRRQGVRTALFMTNPLGLRMPYANLRSHRKVLVVDGSVVFTGGMNIRAAFLGDEQRPAAARDTHFRLEGPVVAQVLAVFTHDWTFTTREALPTDLWGGGPAEILAQDVAARCVASGPDRHQAGTHDMLQGAFAVAQRHIRIQSPYFLPDQILLGALNTAARRGVQVDIVIPGRNNLRLVNYAMTAQLDQAIRGGCRVWRAQGPFDHAKLLTIDGIWSYVGSSNLDPRSLRLNFELDLEVYDPGLAQTISQHIDAAIDHASPVTQDALAALPWLKQLRNRVIWLASPYL